MLTDIVAHRIIILSNGMVHVSILKYNLKLKNNKKAAVIYY